MILGASKFVIDLKVAMESGLKLMEFPGAEKGRQGNQNKDRLKQKKPQYKRRGKGD